MKRGLLLKESPEPRFELFCETYEDNGRCNILFDTPEEMEKHQLKVHNRIYGIHYTGDPSWYHTDYLEREKFRKLKFQLPIRPKRRFNVTKEMIENIGGRSPNTKKCWCGKPKDQWDSRHFQTYCCDAHREQWWILTDYVGPHKNKYLHKHKQCEWCGLPAHHGWDTSNLEMDHIIALVFGGHPWHEDNLQALCKNCHKIKTKSDVGILAWWKRQIKYDTGPEIPDSQTTLDKILQYNYVWN